MDDKVIDLAAVRAKRNAVVEAHPEPDVTARTVELARQTAELTMQVASNEDAKNQALTLAGLQLNANSVVIEAMSTRIATDSKIMTDGAAVLRTVTAGMDTVRQAVDRINAAVGGLCSVAIAKLPRMEQTRDDWVNRIEPAMRAALAGEPVDLDELLRLRDELKARYAQ